MEIIRSEHKHGFTKVDHRIYMDKNLSLKAKGMLLLLLCYPADWNFNVREVSHIVSEDKDTVAKILQELEQYGYLTREYVRNGGKFARIHYTVYELPELKYKKSEKGETDD